ncbi:2Fe-2S iron-sulfur cluster-binding protein [Desulfarculus baarsii]
MINLTINGQKVLAEPGSTLLQAAASIGVKIPTLCHHEALEPAGICRLCTVELFDGRRKRFVTSCNHPVREGVEVWTHSEAVLKHRKMLVELILSRCPENAFVRDLAAQYGLERPRFQCDQDNCLLCGLCCRVCELMGPRAITFAGRGTEIEVTTPFHCVSDDCLACGACAAVCPTGNIVMEDAGDEIVMKIGGKETRRAPKQKCAECGRLFAPSVFLADVGRRLPGAVQPAEDAPKICPDCARQVFARKMAMGQD